MEERNLRKTRVGVVVSDKMDKTIVVAVRNQSSKVEMQQKIDELNHQFGGTIRLLASPNIDISSTDIRERVRKGLTIQYFVPSSVMKYINEHHLYQD